MPTPAYLDTDVYLPAGGVNGFELNGHAVNGVGFVDNPFFGATFVLDPYRSVLVDERAEADISAIPPTLLDSDDRQSVQVVLEKEAQVWAPRGESEVRPERVEAEITGTPMALVHEVESVSVVPAEYRTAYVLADHPATTSDTRSDSIVDELPPSQEPDTVDVSIVPAEDRTTKVRRI